MIGLGLGIFAGSVIGTLAWKAHNVDVPSFQFFECDEEYVKLCQDMWKGHHRYGRDD